jgi:hypothetical protein
MLAREGPHSGVFEKALVKRSPRSMKFARILGMFETMASSPSSRRTRMMFGFAATGAGVGVGLPVGVVGEVRPDPPHAAPNTLTDRAKTSFLGGFTW